MRRALIQDFTQKCWIVEYGDTDYLFSTEQQAEAFFFQLPTNPNKVQLYQNPLLNGAKVKSPQTGGKS